MADAERTRRELRNRAKLALWLAVPFIALMLLVSPRGDFPLNDDWVYAKMVQALADRGHFGLSPFSNAYALTQTLYAAPLVKLFGFSFTLLRLTTIFMGWVTVCITAFTARELGLSNRSAILAALTVFVNPLFINLCYTFMTDVPFCAFTTISTYYYVKAFRSPTTTNLLLGTLFSIAAFYDRQFGALAPVAFAVASFSFWRHIGLATWRTLVTLAAVWIVCLAPLYFLHWTANPVSLEVIDMSPGWNGWVIIFTFVVPVGVAFLGVFLSPLIIARFVHEVNRPAGALRYEAPIAAFLSLIVSGLLLGFSDWFLAGTYLSPPQIIRLSEDIGAGLVAFSFLRPRSFDNWIPTVMTVPSHPAILYCVLIAGAWMAMFFIVYLFMRIRMRAIRGAPVRRSQWLLMGILAVGVLVAPGVAMSGFYFDRYYVAAMPFLALLAASGVRSRRFGIAYVVASLLLGTMCTFSIVGLQDYMAWNTARWQAVDVLRSKYHAHDNEINGGFEFNGMYTSEEYLRRAREEPETFAREKWWVVGETYFVSPIDVSQHFFYEVIETVPYYSWLGFETRQMYILRHKHTAP